MHGPSHCSTVTLVVYRLTRPLVPLANCLTSYRSTLPRWLPTASHSLPLLKSTHVTWCSGVCCVGQFWYTEQVGRWTCARVARGRGQREHDAAKRKRAREEYARA